MDEAADEATAGLIDDVTDSGVFQAVLDGYDAVYDALPSSRVFTEIWGTNAYGADFPVDFAHIGFLTVDEGRRLLELLRLGANDVLVDVDQGGRRRAHRWIDQHDRDPASLGDEGRFGHRPDQHRRPRPGGTELQGAGPALADRAAFRLVLVALIGGAGTFVVWLAATGDVEKAMLFAITVVSSPAPMRWVSRPRPRSWWGRACEQPA
jgi:hypothetical protein